METGLELRARAGAGAGASRCELDELELELELPDIKPHSLAKALKIIITTAMTAKMANIASPPSEEEEPDSPEVQSEEYVLHTHVIEVEVLPSTEPDPQP